MRKKSRVWLFPGNRWHSGDQPIDTKCSRCGYRAAISYNSCRNRHCPKCQTGARERWIQARRSLDHTRWVRSRSRFFLSIQVLRRVFRGKFVAGLKSAFQHGQLRLSGDLARLAQPKIFASWLRPRFRKDWVVYSKPPFGGPEYVLQYLGCYTHRVAISNHRLVSFTDQQVTFRGATPLTTMNRNS